MELATLKLVGFAEVVHVLLDRLAPDSSIVLFGGQAKDRPYPGSTTVSTVNGGISGSPGRCAGARADPRQRDPSGDRRRQPVLARQAAGRPRGPSIEDDHGKLATMADIVDATRFLLENPSVEGIDLAVDNGRMMF